MEQKCVNYGEVRQEGVAGKICELYQGAWEFWIGDFGFWIGAKIWELFHGLSSVVCCWEGGAGRAEGLFWKLFQGLSGVGARYPESQARLPAPLWEPGVWSPESAAEDFEGKKCELFQGHYWMFRYCQQDKTLSDKGGFGPNTRLALKYLKKLNNLGQ